MNHSDPKINGSPNAGPGRAGRADVLRVLSIAVAFAGVQAAVVFGVHRSGIPWRALYRDPNAIADQPYFFGWWSTIGGTLLVVAGALAIFAWSALSTRDRGLPPFLLRGGLLSLMLGADDLLMIHDGLLVSAGVPEVATFAFYGGVSAAWLWSGRSVVHSADRLSLLFLAVGIAALACSVAVDLVGGPLIVEDSSKLMGILFWSLFFWRVSLMAVRQAGPHSGRQFVLAAPGSPLRMPGDLSGPGAPPGASEGGRAGVERRGIEPSRAA